MALDSGISTFHVRLDAKRRPTLPIRLLEDAGLVGVGELIARADGPGRIVLEDPAAMLSALQDRVGAALEESGESAESIRDSLLADRAADTSLQA
jgi:bifunctional DNA-binding transcriptional regulator/antitoxin component of YhaV-PrlF toxin-antitoxin module